MLRLGSVLVASVLVLAACGSTAEDRAISGAGIGAAAGAIIGAVTGLTVLEGAALFATGGALTGVLTDESNLDLGEPLWRRSAAANAQQSLHYHRAPGPGRALVAGLQTELGDLGYDPGSATTRAPIDGIMGPRTSVAISRYQKDHKLLIDGQASVELAQHILDQPE